MPRFTMMFTFAVCFLMATAPVEADEVMNPVGGATPDTSIAANASPEAHTDQQAETDVQAVLTQQIQAFLDDNSSLAFSFATPEIRAQFQTPDRFMYMVRTGYEPVYRPRKIAFSEFLRDGDHAVQEVLIQAMDGALYTAVFPMTRQPGGEWRVSGCMLNEQDGREI